jgi:hypothetical protein
MGRLHLACNEKERRALRVRGTSPRDGAGGRALANARTHREQRDRHRGSEATVHAFLKLWPAPLLIAGCEMLTGPTVADAAKERAAIDLSCPTESIGTYRAAGGSVVAHGCGAWTQYACFYSRRTPVCVPELPARVIPDGSTHSEITRLKKVGSG